MYKDWDLLDEEYMKWLDEHCLCDIENDGCYCPAFEKWYNEKMQEKFA
jgi:hypothetical protein